MLKSLVEDVTDTLRALRAADALRQRGTVLVTSGGYPIFVDQTTGSNVYALRLEEDQLYLLAAPNTISAGEANIASSELETSGDLRISFHRGSFNAFLGATEYAAHAAAFVLYDIQRDIIRSFIRTANDPALRPASELLILLEETDDNPSFVQQVQSELRLLDPEVANRVRLTPSLTNAHPLERDRYLAAEPLNWGSCKRAVSCWRVWVNLVFPSKESISSKPSKMFAWQSLMWVKSCSKPAHPHRLFIYHSVQG